MHLLRNFLKSNQSEGLLVSLAFDQAWSLRWRASDKSAENQGLEWFFIRWFLWGACLSIRELKTLEKFSKANSGSGIKSTLFRSTWDRSCINALYRQSGSGRWYPVRERHCMDISGGLLVKIRSIRVALELSLLFGLVRKVISWDRFSSRHSSFLLRRAGR